MVVEDDMTMSLDEFSRKYAREDGEPECVYSLVEFRRQTAILIFVQPLTP